MLYTLKKSIVVEVTGYNQEYPTNVRYHICDNITIFTMNVYAPLPQLLMFLKIITIKYCLPLLVFACNDCHNLLMFCLDNDNIITITVKGIDFGCIIHDISQSDANHLLENSVFDDPGYILERITQD